MQINKLTQTPARRNFTSAWNKGSMVLATVQTRRGIDGIETFEVYHLFTKTRTRQISKVIGYVNERFSVSKSYLFWRQLCEVGRPLI